MCLLPIGGAEPLLQGSVLILKDFSLNFFFMLKFSLSNLQALLDVNRLNEARCVHNFC